VHNGTTYNCGGHGPTYAPDYYAIDFNLTTGNAVSAIASGTAHTAHTHANNTTTYAATWHTGTYNDTNAYGYWVYVDQGLLGSGPNHLYSIYAHLGTDDGTNVNPFAVADGANVNRGDTIGYSGYTGTAYGAHLHFTLHVSSVANAPWGDGTLATALNAEPLSGYTHFEQWGLHGSPPAQSSNCNDITGVDSGNLTSAAPPPACTSVAETASPASPQDASTPITFTGTASGCTNPQYEFWARWQGDPTWYLLQSYSNSATYAWNSTGAAAGTEYFGVWACSGTCPSPTNDTYASISYTVTVTPCTAAYVSTYPTSPRPAGTLITISGSSVTCHHPLFEFWARWQGDPTWYLLQGYSSQSWYDWDSTGAAAGTEYFGVWAKDASSPTSTFDKNVSMPFTVCTPSPTCSAP
jgi:hypothetical protein